MKDRRVLWISRLYRAFVIATTVYAVGVFAVSYHPIRLDRVARYALGHAGTIAMFAGLIATVVGWSLIFGFLRFGIEPPDALANSALAAFVLFAATIFFLPAVSG